MSDTTTPERWAVTRKPTRVAMGSVTFGDQTIVCYTALPSLRQRFQTAWFILRQHPKRPRRLYRAAWAFTQGWQVRRVVMWLHEQHRSWKARRS